MSRAPRPSVLPAHLPAVLAALLLALGRAAPAPALDAPGGIAPPPALDGVAVAARPGTRLPLDAELTTDEGRRVRLGGYFDGARPILLVLGYYHCPMLCPLVFSGLARALAGMPATAETPPPRVLTVSIDPRETPADARTRRAEAIAALGAAPIEWRFLVGDAATVAAVAEAVGYRYRRDPTSDAYAHPAAVFVLTGDGRLARVLPGVAPTTAELTAAIAAARRGDVDGDDGASAGGVLAGLLQCFRYTPALRRHGAAVAALLRVGGALVLLALAAVVVAGLRRMRTETHR